MSGEEVVKLTRRKAERLEIVTLIPARATELLEHNTINRPIGDQHVKRIASQIIDGKWMFNGDTIKISDDGEVVDGQHRLWACIESKKPIETVIVYGVPREAFATVDTLRKPRSGADILALNGAARYRNIAASALQWLIRWQSGHITEWRDPKYRVENSDIEAFFRSHPGIVRAVERAVQIRSIGNPSIIGFFYYLLSNKAPDLAERMANTLSDPSSVSVNDPYFRLRAYFTGDHHKRKEPLMSIALMVKSTNAAKVGRGVSTLKWTNQGKNAEPFPVLKV
jgi:hypothetical protein